MTRPACTVCARLKPGPMPTQPRMLDEWSHPRCRRSPADLLAQIPATAGPLDWVVYDHDGRRPTRIVGIAGDHDEMCRLAGATVSGQRVKYAPGLWFTSVRLARARWPRINGRLTPARRGNAREDQA